MPLHPKDGGSDIYRKEKLTGIARDVAAIYKALYGVEFTMLSEEAALRLLKNEDVQKALVSVGQNGMIWRRQENGMLRGMPLRIIAAVMAPAVVIGCAGVSEIIRDVSNIKDAAGALLLSDQIHKIMEISICAAAAGEISLDYTIADFENGTIGKAYGAAKIERQFMEKESGKYALKLSDVRSDNWATYAIDTDSIDITKYHALEFSVKGMRGDEKMFVKITDGARQYNSENGTKLITGITTEWARVSIPLADFEDVNLKNITQIAFSFGQDAFGQQALNPRPTIIYIDRITLKEGNDPTAVNVSAVSDIPEAAINTASALPEDQQIEQWLDNTTTAYGLPRSFGASRQQAAEYFKQTGDASGAIYIAKGMFIYDGALAQIFWAKHGDFEKANRITNMYAQNFQPGYGAIRKDQTGYLPHIIDAQGKWQDVSPATNSAVTWETGIYFSGANAWAGIIGPLQVYYLKYNHAYLVNAPELKLAEEITAAGDELFVAEIGGIRMAPEGSGKDDKWYNTISTENMDSWYAGWRMLMQITDNKDYGRKMEDAEKYFKTVYIPSERIFATGMHYDPAGGWIIDTDFSTDSQLATICSLSPEKIDSMFGRDTAYYVWQSARQRAGILDGQGNLTGFCFTDSYRSNVKSVELTELGIIAAGMLADYYQSEDPQRSIQLRNDAASMEAADNSMKILFGNGMAAWPYSDKRAPNGLGEIAAGNIPSTTSTIWVAMRAGRI